MPTAALPQGTIHYRTSGPPDAPRPVVFVHGFLVDGEVWSPVAERLAARGIRSISPDWPLGAHREPTDPDADLSPRGIARLVIALLNQLDLRNVTLVGNDTGGAIVQFVLDELRETGDDALVASVVLTNCDAFEVFPPRRFKPLFGIGRHPLLARLFLAPTRWQPVRHSPMGFGPLSATPLDPALTRRWVQPALTQRDIRRDIARFTRAVRPAELAEVSSRLGSFPKPVRLVWGTADTAFTIDLAERLAAVLPDATIVTVDNARTFVCLDAPDQLTDEIVTVLGQVGSRRN